MDIQKRMVVCGEDCGQLVVYEDAYKIAEQGVTLGEIRSHQLAKLRRLGGTSVVVCLGYQDIIAGCDEGFYHAEVVALVDELLTMYIPAQLAMLTIPKMPNGCEALSYIRLQCNGAAQNVAKLRHVEWIEIP